MAKLQSSKLGIGRDSRVISKFKPKIRIIHIYAPEIIKTDAANFRELVQRLTGKPEDDDDEEHRGKNKSKTAPTKHDLHTNKAMTMMTMEEEEEDHEQELLNLQNGKRVIKNEHDDDKEEEEEEVKGNDDDIWRKTKSNEKISVFLDEFSELDGFMEEFNTLPVIDQN